MIFKGDSETYNQRNLQPDIKTRH